MGLCAIETADKRALGKAVGEDLLQQHGKKRFYSVKEVQESVNRNNFPMDGVVGPIVFLPHRKIFLPTMHPSENPVSMVS